MGTATEAVGSDFLEGVRISKKRTSHRPPKHTSFRPRPAAGQGFHASFLESVSQAKRGARVKRDTTIEGCRRACLQRWELLPTLTPPTAACEIAASARTSSISRQQVLGRPAAVV